MMHISSDCKHLLQIVCCVAGIGHEENVDTETIPDPIPKANFKPVKVNGEPTVITFDLETTGLSKLFFTIATLDVLDTG